jgi:hypothetical protein
MSFHTNYNLDDERTVSVEYNVDAGDVEVIEVWDNDLKVSIELPSDQMDKLIDWLAERHDPEDFL